MSGVGYRVSSAQGPETTRHGAELRPITKVSMPLRLPRCNRELACRSQVEFPALAGWCRCRHPLQILRLPTTNMM
jgi:hypothetical protein